MKIKEIKEKKEAELQKLLREKREKLRELRFTLATGKLKNSAEIKQAKKDVARILTVLNERKTHKNKK